MMGIGISDEESFDPMLLFPLTTYCGSGSSPSMDNSWTLLGSDISRLPAIYASLDV